MFIINLYRYLKGYVEIEASGEFYEKILNLFAANRVNVWEIESKKSSITLKMSISDFRNIRTIRGKNKFKIRLLKKYGVQFILKRYALRLGIPIGLLLFMLTLNILSMFVWNVQVVGNENLSSQKILSACEKIGVKNAVLTKSIDSQLMREKLLLECRELAWCSFNIEGSRVTVNVVEIKNGAEKGKACNIVSDYDCVITEILVESGMPMVQKGQAVKKGELLVSGISDISGVNKFVHAKASIRADITETVEVSANFSREKRLYTGEEINKRVLEVFGVKIPLYLGKTAGEYEENLKIKDAYIFGEKVPLRLYNKTFRLYESYDYTSSRTELMAELTEEMNKKIAKISDGCQIISRNIKENEIGITLKYEIRYSKNIGLKENLIFDVSN